MVVLCCSVKSIVLFYPVLSLKGRKAVLSPIHSSQIKTGKLLVRVKHSQLCSMQFGPKWNDRPHHIPHPQQPQPHIINVGLCLNTQNAQKANAPCVSVSVQGVDFVPVCFGGIKKWASSQHHIRHPRRTPPFPVCVIKTNTESYEETRVYKFWTWTCLSSS